MRGSQRAVLLAPPFDPDAIAWAAAVASAGGTVSSAELRLISTLVQGLKSVGAWPALDRIFAYVAAEDATKPSSALIDLKARATSTAVNSPLLTANRGYTFDGATNYLDTGFNAYAAGGNYGLNDASFGVWVVTAPTATGAEIGNDYGAYSMLFVRYSSTTHLFQINSGTYTSAYIATDSSKWTGSFHGQRTSSVLTSLYRNGSLEGTSADSSASIPNKKFGVGAAQVPPSAYSTAQIGAAWIGRSLPDVAGFHNVLRAYMTAKGVP